MLSNRFKVILDNGFKIELIRQVKGYPLRLGSEVVMNVVEESGDVREIFNKIFPEKISKKL